MSSAWWLVFRSSPLRWIVPPAACVCMMLVAGRVGGQADTSMRASSEAALAIFVWAPAVLLLVFAGVRASGLSRADDVLILPTQRRVRLARSLSVLGAQFAWTTLGWIGLWAGCSILASRAGTPIYWSMAANGLAITTVTSVTGAFLAIHRRPAWVAALASAGSYVGLAIWIYIPDVPGSILYSPYCPLFFVEALPNRHVLGLQLVWALAVAVVLTAWAGRILGTRWSVILLAVTAAATAAVSATMPPVIARSGVIELNCAAHDGVQVCMWADHERARSRIAAEVALAQSLLGPAWQDRFVAENDWGGFPAALPTAARPANTVLIPASANPAPRTTAARIVAAALRPPPACPTLAMEGGFGETVGAALERLVIDRLETSSPRTLTEPELAARITAAQQDIARCRSPHL